MFFILHDDALLSRMLYPHHLTSWLPSAPHQPGIGHIGWRPTKVQQTLDDLKILPSQPYCS